MRTYGIVYGIAALTVFGLYPEYWWGALNHIAIHRPHPRGARHRDGRGLSGCRGDREKGPQHRPDHGGVDLGVFGHWRYWWA